MAIVYTCIIENRDGEYTTRVEAEQPQHRVVKALAGACIALTLGQGVAVASMMETSGGDVSLGDFREVELPETASPTQLPADTPVQDDLVATHELKAGIAEAVEANKPEKLPDLGMPWMLPTVKYYSREIITAAQEFGIDPRQLAMQMALETAGYRNIPPSPANARGIMQFIPDTEAAVAAQLGLSPGTYDITDPTTATRFAAREIANIQEKIRLARQANGLPPPTEFELFTMSAAGYHSGPQRAVELAVGINSLGFYGQNYYVNIGAMFNETSQPTSPTLERLWPKLEPNASRAVADFQAQGIDIFAVIP